MTDDPVLQTLVERIVAVFEPEAVYLFGSRARGQASADSDYDFLVVLPDDREIGQAWRDTARVRREGAIGIDIVPCRHDDFRRRQMVAGTLSYRAAREGRVVYAH